MSCRPVAGRQDSCRSGRRTCFPAPMPVTSLARLLAHPRDRSTPAAGSFAPSCRRASRHGPRHAEHGRTLPAGASRDPPAPLDCHFPGLWPAPSFNNNDQPV
ncbi:hypothetical protein dqs_2433 [Azoarcus olearius]|nr:hypothetical protein dqs_2433 [Azoarcus olearius]